MCVYLGVGKSNDSSTYRSAAALYNEWLLIFNIFGILPKLKKWKGNIHSKKQLPIWYL